MAFVPFAEANLSRLSMQVSGLNNFEESRWRECFLYYLFGIWGNQKRVTYRPKVNFCTGTGPSIGMFELRLDRASGEYFACGSCAVQEPPTFYGDQVLIVSYKQAEVEQALVRFVKNNSIKMLIISLRKGVVHLWKKPQRSCLGVLATGIPTFDEI